MFANEKVLFESEQGEEKQLLAVRTWLLEVRNGKELKMVLESRSIRVWNLKWDAAKAKANFRLHGVPFELAQTVFRDAFAVERLDDREDYGEERFIIIGMAAGQVILFVVYTQRGERIRIISAQRATPA